MSHRNLHLLFSYGTLRNPEIQKRLFGTVLRQTPARLIGHAVYECQKDGYYFLKKESGSEVEGHLIELNDEQLWICDQWEEVPLYIQEVVQVETPGGHQDAIVYRKTNAAGNVRVNLSRKSTYSAHILEDTLREAEAFRTRIESFPEYKTVIQKRLSHLSATDSENKQ